MINAWAPAAPLASKRDLGRKGDGYDRCASPPCAKLDTRPLGFFLSLLTCKPFSVHRCNVTHVPSISLSLNIRERGVNSGQSTIPSLCRITDTKYDIRSLFFPLPIYSPIPCMLKSKQDLSLRPIYPEFQNNIELNDRVEDEIGKIARIEF